MNDKEIIVASTDQVFSLASRFATRVNSLRIPEARVKEIIAGDEEFWAWIDAALLPKIAPVPDTTDTGRCISAIRDWEKFYKKYFGLAVDLSNVRIPDKVPGFERLIVIAEGVSINQVYDTGKKNFGSWKWCDGDIESVMQESERGPVKAAYAIWVRDNQEADEDLKNLSAETVERPQDTENLLERLLHGFKFWSEKKEHLDIETVTLCASSRYADGNVPHVFRFNDGHVGVDGYDVDVRRPFLRARRAVR